jgi:glutaredoxin
MRIILYGKPDCSLCSQLKIDLQSIQPEIDFVLVERNIEEDNTLYERFRYLIPVLEIDNRTLLYPPHSWHQVYQALQAARQGRGA